MAEQFAENANTTLDNIPTTAFPAGAPPAKRWIQPVEKNAGAVLATTHQSAVAADGNGTPATVSGYGGIVFQVTGTFAATVNFEATVDGANWVALPVMDASGAQRTTTLTPGIFWANILGLEQVRARISGYTSGAVTVVSRALAEPMPIQSSVQLSGSLVDEAENALRVETVAQNWLSFNFNDVAEVTVTAGAILEEASWHSVNGYATLRYIAKRMDTSHDWRLEALWQYTGSGSTYQVVELLHTAEAANSATQTHKGTTPVGSQYVKFRIRNDDTVDHTYHVHGMLTTG